MQTSVNRCKDGCCPRTEPYPTWLTVAAAGGMLGMFGVVIVGLLMSFFAGQIMSALALLIALGVMFASLRGK